MLLGYLKLQPAQQCNNTMHISSSQKVEAARRHDLSESREITEAEEAC